MKIAKANEADLKMAMELCGALEALTCRWSQTVPEKIKKPHQGEESEYFDIDDAEQCARVLRYLLGLAGNASLLRVVLGYAVMLDPSNKCVDPEVDVIEHHPDTKAGIAAKQARPLEEWDEDIGPALWWTFPVCEPPYSGTPGDEDWPYYHTHWTPLVIPDAPSSEGTVPSK